ncbi:beta strand repeat-containing protein [Bdellovibrio sp. HCB274]|uniref:beta strand repeat-containing protein n=1 Tax=Bdellovibrio sp. HCB274 TaxID=3394361 RepID=UPI0039B4598B
MQRLYVIGLFILLMFTCVNSRADENWTGTKNPGDYTSAGVVTITGATTFNPGTYTFSTLILNTGVTLLVNSDTGTGTGVVINATTITITGTIDGNGRGYSNITGTGKGLIDGTGATGGCHGGLAGTSKPMDNCVQYGNPIAPTTIGSPGGKQSNTPGVGGGAIKLEASGTLTVTGTISMNGTDSTGAGVTSGSGSGGSIWLKGATITGNGTVRANGGPNANSKGAGGGGRILFSYATDSFTGTASVAGGTSNTGYSGYEGKPGSLLYLDHVNNDLVVKSYSTFSNGSYSFRNITINAGATLDNSAHGSKSNTGTGKGAFYSSYGSGASHGGRGEWAMANFTATYGSALEPTTQGSGGGGRAVGTSPGGIGGGAIKLTLSGTLTVNGILGSEGYAGEYYTDDDFPGGGSGGSIWIIANSVSGNGTISVMGGDGAVHSDTTILGGAGGGGRLAIYYSTSFSSSLTLTAAPGAGWNNNYDGSGTGSVVVINTTTNDLSFPVNSSISNGTYSFNNITLAAGVKVWALEGNPGDTGTGKGTSSGSGGGGGGYGGAGSAGTGGAGGGTYGVAATPTDLGSGGGSCGTAGAPGFGGGQIRLIVANTLTINTGANLTANGNNVVNNTCGGGSGGSIWINTKNLTSVTNGITARGGNGDGNGGVGGGGRIAIYYSGTYSGTLNVNKGTGHTGGANGTATTAAIGVPTTLFYHQQPSTSAVQGISFTQQPITGAKDALGNVVVEYSTSIVLTAFTDNTCTTAAPQILNNGSSGVFSSGYSVYSGVNYTRMATIYLKATSGALTSACSSAIAVATNPATQLVFATQPSSTAVTEQLFAQQPIVEGRDPNNLLDITFNGAVSVVAYADRACTVMASGALSGTAVTSLGVAAYSGMSYDDTGVIYVRASSGGLTTACSSLVDVRSALNPWFFRGY